MQALGTSGNSRFWDPPVAQHPAILRRNLRQSTSPPHREGPNLSEEFIELVLCAQRWLVSSNEYSYLWYSRLQELDHLFVGFLDDVFREIGGDTSGRMGNGSTEAIDAALPSLLAPMKGLGIKGLDDPYAFFCFKQVIASDGIPRAEALAGLLLYKFEHLHMIALGMIAGEGTCAENGADYGGRCILRLAEIHGLKAYRLAQALMAELFLTRIANQQPVA